jgi:hypothetical protein
MLKNAFIFLGALIITIIGLEVFLNFTRITPPTLKYYDKEYGSLNRPNIKYFKSVEGLMVGNTNYDGRFRENYPFRKADKKTLRILLLGDSFVEGIDVFGQNHFAQYLEDILSKKLNRKVEVLNCGRGNATLFTMSYYFINYLSKNYDVDLVLILTDGRDIVDYGPGAGYPSTSYTFDSAGNLARVTLWTNTPEYRLYNKLSRIPIVRYYDNSSYFRLLYRAVARTKINGIGEMTFGKLFEGPKAINYNSDTVRDTISDLTKKLYDTMNKFDKGQMIYLLRSKPTFSPAVLDYMKLKGYRYIDLTDTFSGFLIKSTKTDAYYFKATKTYGGHWNNDGHKAVGAYLANKIYDSINTYKMPGYEK